MRWQLEMTKVNYMDDSETNYHIQIAPIRCARFCQRVFEGLMDS